MVSIIDPKFSVAQLGQAVPFTQRNSAKEATMSNSRKQTPGQLDNWGGDGKTQAHRLGAVGQQIADDRKKLCFACAPGVGKTSIAKSILRATSRNSIQPRRQK
jgi:ATP-dependent Lon protease